MRAMPIEECYSASIYQSVIETSTYSDWCRFLNGRRGSN
ncbi:hypothetical protein VCRA2113O420_50023 [Vibrio crassostreae]|nr:hypothetical protein VCRA2113O420_50023 [Vibrio crassostreae]